MRTSVKLQDPFSYSLIPIIILGLLIIILFGIWLYKRRKPKVKKAEEIVIKKAPKENLAGIKAKYLKKIDEVEKKLKEDKIKLRGAYQELSSIIRFFTFEVTGIKVQNYTLQDIESLNMPELTELIQEYYAPEFAQISKGNIEVSLAKTRKVIEKWN